MAKFAGARSHNARPLFPLKSSRCYSASGPENNSVWSRGYYRLDAVLSHARPPYQLGASVQSLLNANWNEAQGATTGYLRGEAAPVIELNFTSSTPCHLKLNGSLFLKRKWWPQGPAAVFLSI